MNRKFFALIFLFLLLFLSACSAQKGLGAPMALATPPAQLASEPTKPAVPGKTIATQVVLPAPVDTPTAAPFAQNRCSQPVDVQVVDGWVAYQGIQFQVDPSLGLQFQAYACAEDRDPQTMEIPKPHPAYIGFKAQNLLADNVFNPEIRVYTITNGMQDFRYPLNSLDVLAGTLDGQQELAAWFQGAPLHALEQRQDFQNGSGIRGAIELMQDYFFFTNNYLQYAYDGLSSDGRYYISVRFPFQAAFLMTLKDPIHLNNINPQAIPVPAWPENFEEQRSVIENYNQEALRRFSTAQGGEFSPNLAALDHLVSSLKIEQ